MSGKATAAPGVYTATISAKDGHNAAVTGTVKITIGPLGAVAGSPARLVKGGITVGCRFYTKSIRSCTASVLSGRKTVAKPQRVAERDRAGNRIACHASR